MYRLGDPLNLRMSGVVINQPDLPHWAAEVLNWLGMVQVMQQAVGETGKIYGEFLKRCLEDGDSYPYTNAKTGRTVTLHGPAAIYGLYQSFSEQVKRDAK